MQVGRRHRRRRIGVLRVRKDLGGDGGARLCCFLSLARPRPPGLLFARPRPRREGFVGLRSGDLLSLSQSCQTSGLSHHLQQTLPFSGMDLRFGQVHSRLVGRGRRRRERTLFSRSVSSPPRRSSIFLLSRLSRPVRPDIRVVSGVQLVPAHFAEWMIADVMSRPQTVPETSPGFALTLAWL